jgi:hypothetical protein
LPWPRISIQLEFLTVCGADLETNRGLIEDYGVDGEPFAAGGAGLGGGDLLSSK